MKLKAKFNSQLGYTFSAVTVWEFVDLSGNEHILLGVRFFVKLPKLFI